jgi:hypothetical protein
LEVPVRIEEVRIENPCDADWEGMHGDARSRFCDSCAKSVHHLSAMTRREAESLLEGRASSLCVRYSATHAGEVQFAARTVKSTAPSWQVSGVRRLVAGAATLVAGTVVMQSVAMAQPPETYPIAGGIPPVYEPGPPVVPSKPPGLHPMGEGSGSAEGSGPCVTEEWMGEMPYEPQLDEKAGQSEKVREVAELQAIYHQERVAARLLARFGILLDEVEFVDEGAR